MSSCKAMDLATSTYYYRSTSATEKAAADREICSRIEEILEELPLSGYRTVTTILKKEMTINRKRVSRIMRENGLQCRKRKRFKPQTTDSKHGLKKYSNLLKDPENAKKPVIVGDVTYYDVNGKNHYCSHLMDLTNREIIGSAVSDRLDTELVAAALREAIECRGSLAGYIHHTDSDSRYCSGAYINLLQESGAAISMCRGNAYENAHAESFNSTLKRQEINLRSYESLEASAQRIFEYIDKYNTFMPHSALDGMSPVEYREKFLQNSKN